MPVDQFLKENVPAAEVEDVKDYYSSIHGRAYRNGSPEGVLRAERRGSNVLIAFRTNGWVSSVDGTTTKHRLAYHWLASSSADLCEVQGTDSIIISEPDPDELLFHQFRLFA
jgi:hypothetical protein